MKLSVPLGVNNIMVLPTWTICSPQIFFPKIPFFSLLSSLHDNSYKTVWLLWHCERPWKLATAKGRCLTLRASNWHTKKIYISIQIKHFYDVYKHNIFIKLFMNVWCFCPEDLFYVQNESCRDFLKHIFSKYMCQTNWRWLHCAMWHLSFVSVCVCVHMCEVFSLFLTCASANLPPILFPTSLEKAASFTTGPISWFTASHALSLVFSMQNAALLPMEIRNSQ